MTKEKYNPKVSIIIPVYNSENYIKRCLDSVLNQTYKNIELIVINDGSKDRSDEILNNYKEKYPSIINYLKQTNHGVAYTRNKGINIAKGEYIFFIDNDDFIDKEYIETFINQTKNGKYDLVIGGYKRPNSKGKITTKFEPNTNSIYTHMRLTAPWARTYKKDFLIKNDLKFLDNNLGEDIYLNIQAFFITSKINIINYIGYNWYYNEKSVSNTTQKNLKKADIFKLLNSLYDSLKERNLIEKNYEEIEYCFIFYIFWFIFYSSKKQKFKDISKEYNKLFKWLKERFPDYKHNSLIGINKPKEAAKGIQLFYWGAMLLHKLGLGKIAAFLYSLI